MGLLIGGFVTSVVFDAPDYLGRIRANFTGPEASSKLEALMSRVENSTDLLAQSTPISSNLSSAYVTHEVEVPASWLDPGDYGGLWGEGAHTNRSVTAYLNDSRDLVALVFHAGRWVCIVSRNWRNIPRDAKSFYRMTSRSGGPYVTAVIYGEHGEHGEQGGAHQPASRSEFESKGNSTSNPEAEGRPR